MKVLQTFFCYQPGDNLVNVSQWKECVLYIDPLLLPLMLETSELMAR